MTNTNTAQKHEDAAGVVVKFTSAAQIASSLGVHRKTVLRWASSGLIRRHKINARVVLFQQSEVNAFLNSARI